MTLPRWGVVAVFSPRLPPLLSAVLGATRIVRNPSRRFANRVDAAIGLGPLSWFAARRYGERFNVPAWRADAGFLRSPVKGPALSMVFDDRSPHYDASSASRIERLLNSQGEFASAAEIERATRAMAEIRRTQLSVFNDTPPDSIALGKPPSGHRVLVVDQDRGDRTAAAALAHAHSFDQMLESAIAENPVSEIVVLTSERGHLWRARTDERVKILDENHNPIALIEEVDRVYAVSSHVGFEALMCGRPVTLFGSPFYSGWGLTDDRRPLPRRTRDRTLAEVFVAAYLRSSRYADPDTGKSCELEQVIDNLALQREQFARNRGSFFCFGFHLWKLPVVRSYLRSPGNEIVFARSVESAEARGFNSDSKLLVWGQRGREDAAELARRHDVPVWCMEDGFLRSVGLGSDLEIPASLVIDSEGIYYDPRGPSELETILQTREFSERDLVRAAALRERIVAAAISKYNVGEDRALDIPRDRKVVLVPGQVEDDASIELGTLDISTNAGLLEEARAANPDAFVIFKPHPDVLSGNRNGAVPRGIALELADRVEDAATLPQCLAVADEVHTMTSLVGFESLMRGLRVVVYGQPFYSGWGLTDDRHPVSRRTRELSLDELVAGTLIHYPRYINRKTMQFTTPEAVLEQLRAERDANSGARAIKMSRFRRNLRKLGRYGVAIASMRQTGRRR